MSQRSRGGVLDIPPSVSGPLSAFSASLGTQPMMVQGAGGNTSIKDGEVLWVKGSGTWLAQANQENIFVPCELDALRLSIDRGGEDSAAFVIGQAKLKPSIEALLHAIMPQRVVVHVHAINTLACGVRRDGPAIADRLLGGMRWAWIEYQRPGLPLARAVAAAMDREVDVFLLANHGLIVGADDFESAEALVYEVEKRLFAPPRSTPPTPTAALSKLARSEGLHLPRHLQTHALATDPQTMSLGKQGPFYPDHVVFLGPKWPAVNGSSISRTRQDLAAADSDVPRYWIVEGEGVLVDPAITAGAQEMLLCLALLLQRLDGSANLARLQPGEIRALLDWDAEKDRQSLDQVVSRPA